MKLREIHDLNQDQLRGQLSVVAAKHPMRKLGEVMQSMVLAFEAEGIFRLLADLDEEGFHANLQHAVHARLFFLRKSGQEGSLDDSFGALSRTPAVFCAIACGQGALALELRTLGPQSQLPSGEYAEEFAYHAFVHALLAKLVGKPEARSPTDWLAELEQHVSAIPSPGPADLPRVEVARALLADEANPFWEAFEQLAEVLHDEAKAAAPRREGMLYEFPWLAAPWHISTELLALLELARMKGWPAPQRDYPLCPFVARAPAQPRRVPDVFDDIERLLPPTP